MKKYLFLSALVAAYVAGYCDYLSPGFLKFALPAAWDLPMSTKTTYDLAAGVRNTAKCAALEAVPNWAKPGNWKLGKQTEEPKTCKQRLKEQEDS